MDRQITPYFPFNTPISQLSFQQKNVIINRYRSLKNINISVMDFKETLESLIREIKIEYPNQITNKKIAFFFYLAKIKNYLKAESYIPDLSMILFLESLSRSAKNGNRFVIIAENEFFDKNVLNLPYNTYNRTMAIIERFKEEFGMFSNLEFISMKELNDQITDFQSTFNDIKDKISIDKESEVYKVLRESISFRNIKHALKHYKTEATLERVDRVYVNYMAFLKAREQVRYWDRLIEKYGWVRGTVSKKQGVVYIYPSAFNIPAAHSIFNIRILKDSYLIDELYYKRISYRVRLDGEPVYYL